MGQNQQENETEPKNPWFQARASAGGRRGTAHCNENSLVRSLGAYSRWVLILIIITLKLIFYKASGTVLMAPNSLFLSTVLKEPDERMNSLCNSLYLFLTKAIDQNQMDRLSMFNKNCRTTRFVKYYFLNQVTNTQLFMPL
jgi:hypothetical protein